MGQITDTANVVWRDYDEIDVPASGAHKPIKPDIRALFALIDAQSSLPPPITHDIGWIATRPELAIAPQSGGYLLLEAGREGHFRWTPGDLSAWVTLDPMQGVYIAPQSDPTGHSGAFVRVRDWKLTNWEWFGAKEWTTSLTPGFDSTLFIQSAVDFSCNEGGRCYGPPKIFQVRDTIRNWGCELFGQVSQADFLPTAAPNRSGYTWGTRLIWPDLGVLDPLVSATKIVLLSESKDDTLVETPPGSGIFIRTALIQPLNHDIIPDGNAQAGFGFYQSTAIRPKAWNMYVERCVDSHFACLPRNGNVIGLQFDNIVTNSRLRPPCKAANGMHIGPTATGYCTGGKGGYGSFSGNLDGTGWGFKLGNVDTFHVDKMESFGFKSNYPHQGQAFYFYCDPTKGNFPCRKSRFISLGGGIVKTDAEAFGIDISGANSEAFQVDFHPNSQVILGSISDAVTGDKHATHTYDLDGEREIVLSAGAFTGVVANDTLGAMGVPAISFPAGVDSKGVWIIPDPPRWNHGQVCTLWVTYGASAADAGKNFRLEVDVRCPRTDGTTDIDNPEFMWIERFNLPAPSVANKLQSVLCHLALPVDFKRRCSVALRSQRFASGSDVLDTSSQTLKISCMKLMFRGDGPNENQGEDQHVEHGRWETGQRLKQDDEHDATGAEGTFVYNDYIGGKQPTIVTTYEAETDALIAAFTIKPWQWQIYQINDTIKLLKNAGLWSKMGLLYILSTPEIEDPTNDVQQALINWKAPGTNTLIVPAVPPAPTLNWARNAGARGVGTGAGSWLTVPINWNAIPLFTQDNAHVGMVCSNEDTNSTANASMIGSATTQNINLRPRDGTGNILTRLNTAAAAASTPNPRSKGHFLLNRSGPAGYDVWIRGVKAATVTAASAPVIAEPIVLLRGAVINGNHRGAAFHAGQNLTDPDGAALAQILTYHVGHCRG